MNYFTVILVLCLLTSFLALLWALRDMVVLDPEFESNIRQRRHKEYYRWFKKRETRLRELYEQEITPKHNCNFDDFCIHLYEGKLWFIYDYVKEMKQ